MLKVAVAARGLDLAPQNRQKPRESLDFHGMRRLNGLALGLCGLMLAGCAAPSPGALAANDPYEQFNRDSLKRNAKIDKYFVIPTVAVYFILVPEPGRRGVHNFLGNL